jgi:Holliday junction resolvase-like predicted endonuclease
LIGWNKGVLCFIEGKTRTTRDLKPAEAAVDRKKRHDLQVVIRDYLRTLPRRQSPEPPAWRFDVITVYYEQKLRESETISHPVAPRKGATKVGQPLSHHRAAAPTFKLFQNAALSS